MTEFSEREAGWFDAEDEQGNPYRVLIFERFMTFEPVRQGVQRIKQPNRYALRDESPVKDGKDGTFIIIDSGTVIRKV
jgi:hypothetical protein